MITKPTLLIDKEKCQKNIRKMALKAEKQQLIFRPHFKTHQSIEIGNWFKAFGVKKITVSSLDMAMYFSKDWNDITVAFPVNILEIKQINQLARTITLNILIESIDTVSFLEAHLQSPVNFFIKIDVGYNRTGVSPHHTDKINNILKASNASSLLTFKGFLAHAGHTYQCRSKQEIIDVHEKALSLFTPLKKQFSTLYPDLILSYGDTPSCSVSDNFNGIDEIRPGNFVFYDLTQHYIGSNTINEIAVTMVCPIVAIHPEKNEILIYGGGVHFSKDYLILEEDKKIYGLIIDPTTNTPTRCIPDTYLKSISQEHGIIAVPEQDISQYNIGQLIHILPVHACMTANSMKKYITNSQKTIERL
ncbi:alanine racemase [Aquimarina hainanensis]|uniref:Alanine racemase n=1 Tax=Aquimarina hainanensis TaxID=1578017 RepID=A0ABW5NAT4_9FLAO